MRVVETFETTASAETVWQVLTDLDRWKDWTPTILEIVPLGERSLEAGARYRVTQPGLKPAVYEVSASVPNENFTWMQKIPGGSLIASHVIRATGESTEVELAFYSEGWAATVVATFLSRKIREFVATEARGLKAQCEGG